MTTLADVRSRALRALIPPPRLQLSTWIEGNIRLPEGVSALPGPVRLCRTKSGLQTRYLIPPLSA